MKKIEAVALQQLECFEAGLLFAKTEGILPAPEATHAIAQAIREANEAKENGEERVIVFNLCGHGHFDMSAYEDYCKGQLKNHSIEQAVLEKSIRSVQLVPEEIS
jgi:tryptophan synthase beta chain